VVAPLDTPIGSISRPEEIHAQLDSVAYIIAPIMAITPGTRIGAYEVTSQLGEGGMGVVLRARDTKLLREVALKILPDHFAEDPDRLSRLQREAQLLASMNHPNIAQIYGLEQLGNTGCIVMEMIEGDTLSERLKSGPLPLDEALDIAKQIADALAAAHERGIVHRDLKPANIKITPSGAVKVLDFGLAKALASREMQSQLSMMPTKVSGSVVGMVVGTVGYMSPEQARGKEVDARTDIWAFGCVLYEMLTGRKAFEGETATDIIARIVSGEPDLSLLPADVPTPIRLLLEATLTKNVQQRLQHIGDMRLFLDRKFFPATASATVAAGPGIKTRQRGRLAAAVALAAGLVLAAIAVALFFRPSPPPPAPQMHLEISLPGIQGAQFAVSPSGQRVAYFGQAADENRAVWIRQVGSETAQKLAGTDNPTGAFWSPDSRSLAFIADGKLKKIDVAGGVPQIISDFQGNPRGYTWNEAGVILFSKTPENIIFRVSDAGGEPKPFTAHDKEKKETLHAAPVFLPDGNHFLFLVVAGTPENSGIFVGSLDSKPPKRLLPLPSRINAVAYAPPGYLLYTNGAVIMAQRFDTSTLTTEGEPEPIADGAENAYFSASNAGLLLYRKGRAAPPTERLTWFDRNGKQTGNVGAGADYGNVELSPKGDRVAVDMMTNSNRDIWVIDISRGVPSRITFDPGPDWTPSWSPEGDRIVFASSRAGTHIYQKSSSGVGNDELVFDTDKSEIPVHWSQGRYVVFSRGRQGGAAPYDTWILDTAEKKMTPFVESPFDKVHARVSPDGRWIAYATNDSGIYQIVVQSFPDPNRGKWQITAQGGVEPKWRRDGRELYYLDLDGKLMAVSVKTDPTFEAGATTELFDTPLTVGRGPVIRDRRYDVSADGRFLIAMPDGIGSTASIIAMVNWASALDKK
jgi:Tol biopolymer transport system component/tRNA A-37 threonylcarbamoyl transferase component Bud32